MKNHKKYTPFYSPLVRLRFWKGGGRIIFRGVENGEYSVENESKTPKATIRERLDTLRASLQQTSSTFDRTKNTLQKTSRTFDEISRKLDAFFEKEKKEKSTQAADHSSSKKQHSPDKNYQKHSHSEEQKKQKPLKKVTLKDAKKSNQKNTEKASKKENLILTEIDQLGEDFAPLKQFLTNRSGYTITKSDTDTKGGNSYILLKKKNTDVIEIQTYPKRTGKSFSALPLSKKFEQYVPEYNPQTKRSKFVDAKTIQKYLDAIDKDFSNPKTNTSKQTPKKIKIQKSNPKKKKSAQKVENHGHDHEHKHGHNH